MISVDENDTDQINNKRKQTHRRKEKSSTGEIVERGKKK